MDACRYLTACYELRHQLASAGTRELRDSFYQHSGQAVLISALGGFYPVQEQPEVTAGLVGLVSIVSAFKVASD